MKKHKRPGIRKNILFFVSLGAVVLLVVGVLLGHWSSQQMRDLVADQFNQEQLVIAKHIAGLIEEKMSFLRKELLLLAERKSGSPFEPESYSETLTQTFHRVLGNGVWKIEVADLEAGTAYTFMPYMGYSTREISEEWTTAWTTAVNSGKGDVWTLSPRTRPQWISLTLGAIFPGNHKRVILFDVNVSWFLAPFVREIRSGKTGYAWLIDDKGIFMAHPNTDFVGQSALEIREEKYPGIPLGMINFIQKEKMLEGQVGTGWYYSGWHRGITGKIKKLIAYCPVTIADLPSQRWSVAVVAPISEIEEAVRDSNFRQLVIQGLIVLVILSGAATILFFERRWNRILEERVERRTRDLKKSEDNYRSLVESAEDFIYSVDLSGRFQSLNSFTANFFGGTSDEFIGKDLGSVFPHHVVEQQRKLIRLVYDFGKSVRGEFDWEMGEHEIWISANFMPLKSDDGAVSAVLCIARDITESKILERQLINAEKLASMGTLAAGVAHEINNPLGVILGFSELLLRKAEKESQEYEDLKTIERQGLHCKEVVENLLSFARHGDGATEYCNLNQCLEEIIRVVRHTLEMNDIELRLELAETLPSVKGDSRQLQQVFLNLINNAIPAMEHGGVLKIRTFLERSTRKGVVEFQDTGVGISPDDLDHIFEPFFTTKPEGQGTGLGLFVSYGIIKKYGGTIDCTSRTSTPSRPGDTTFTVKLLTKRGED